MRKWLIAELGWGKDEMSQEVRNHPKNDRCMSKGHGATLKGSQWPQLDNLSIKVNNDSPAGVAQWLSANP